MRQTTTLNSVVLETGPDGRARFRDEPIKVKPQLFLSATLPNNGYSVRQVGDEAVVTVMLK